MPRMNKATNRKILNLGEKIEVILYHTKSKCSMRKLAQQFNIGKTQAGAIVRDQDKYVKLWQSGTVEIGKRANFSADSIGLIIDKHVYAWYKDLKSEKKGVTGSTLQSKAREVAKELGNEEFKASSGWLDAFKKRHKISFTKPITKNNVSDSLENWDSQLESIIKTYSPDDIYSAHETGLFYHAVPDDTSNLKYETCPSGELPEQRLTVFLCTSMTGKKELPLIITNDETVKIDSDSDNISPCALKFNPEAWMSCEIMTKWFGKLDKKMASQKRKICLFLNNTNIHRSVKLENVEIVYFPPHLLGECHPMNHGIIQSFKTHYRLLMLQHLISQRDMNEDRDDLMEIPVEVSISISWVSAAWDVVSRSLIERSFKSAGFNCLTSEIGQSDNEPSLNEVAELLYAYDSDINAAEYVNIDANLATEAEDLEQMDILDDSVENNGETIMELEKPIKELDLKSYSEAVRNLKFLEHFFVSRCDSTGLSLVHKLLSHTESLLGDEDCSS